MHPVWNIRKSFYYSSCYTFISNLVLIWSMSSSLTPNTYSAFLSFHNGLYSDNLILLSDKALSYIFDKPWAHWLAISLLSHGLEHTYQTRDIWWIVFHLFFVFSVTDTFSTCYVPWTLLSTVSCLLEISILIGISFAGAWAILEPGVPRRGSLSYCYICAPQFKY